MKIQENILKILAECTIEDNTVFLPDIQLDRKTYTSVNKHLENLGGKWNRKAKGHVFSEDPTDSFENMLLTGETTDFKKEFQFFESSQEPGWKNIKVEDKKGNQPEHPNQRFYDKETGRLVQKGLSQVARMFPTPTNSMVTVGDMEQARYAGNDPKRPTYEKANQIFPTPTVNGNHNRKGLSKNSGDGLSTAVLKILPTPTVQDAANNGADSQHKRNSLPLNAVVDGKLNPAWVEWLMGFPAGWTDLNS